ncbi:type VI secretion system protein [Andreprevotia chitinilytica]|uniref:type VI secretion system protein n=1 Tax=Andreprevotia chitinilytica TaxID=396808 RepID=UPI0005508743|nr:type VI secretion system protein [Andreprevotia chitinilytica]
MSFGFLLVLLLAVLLGVAAAWLIWRANAPAGAVSPLDKWFAPLANVGTSADARYKTPWVLLLGQAGAGKSSLVASIPPWLEQGVTDKQKAWSVDGTAWCYCNKGVLIDPDSGLPDAADGTPLASKWTTALKGIRSLRPERPIDGVVLFICAETLRNGDGNAIQTQADSAWRQLTQIQDTFQFSLPVYVVVTRSDEISGFSAFWRAQAPACREEIFGWSAPATSESEPPAQWSAAAFRSMAQSLETLQIRVEGGSLESGDGNADNADHQDTPQGTDNDGFFLFPTTLAKLEGALTQWLETAFRASAWRAGFTCRGIYFTGSVEADGEVKPKPRTDLVFVDDLINSKVLAEPLLASPTQKTIWSRDTVIRSLQQAGVAIGATLLLLLALSSLNLYRQTHTLSAGVANLQRAAQLVSANRCAGKEDVFRLLAGMSQLDSTMLMPWALVDHRVTDRTANTLEQDVFARAVLPSIACQLEQRAQRVQKVGEALPGPATPDQYPYLQYRAALFEELRNVRQLEENIARYNALALPERAGSEKEALQDFAVLAAYAYDVPEVEITRYEKGAFPSVLRAVESVPTLQLAANVRKSYSQQIDRLADGLDVQLFNEVKVGGTLIDNLNHNREPLLGNARQLAWWFNWTRSSWRSLADNPCQKISVELQQETGRLIQLNAPAYGGAEGLGALPRKFDATNCGAKAFQTLDTLTLSPYGQVFVQVNGARDLNPALVPEQAGLNALLNLGFMQLNPVRPFHCVTPMVGWREDTLGQAKGFISEYQRFAQQQNLATLAADTTKQPLYARVALDQLERSLNSTMNDAQVPEASLSTLPAVSSQPVSGAEAELAQESSAFSRAIGPLSSIVDSYTQLGFASSGTTLTSCMRTMASGRLSAVNALADDGQLYNPSTPLGQSSFFAPQGTPALNNYLAQQAARAQVLVGYASPFVQLLRNSTGVNETTDPSATTVDYWANTIDQLNRYQQKDLSGTVGQLNGLLTNINPMTDQNCHTLLAANPLGASSNDLFFSRRQQLLNDTTSRCNGYVQASAMDAWQNLTRRFRDLAGRYPFGPLSAADADPQTVRRFFTDYSANSAALRNAVKALPSSFTDEGNEFLDQLDEWNTFFSTNLTAQGDMQPVHLVLTFRAQQAYSQGTEQLVSWLLSSGTRMAGFPNQATTLDWPYGQMMVLDLNWADRSLWSPGVDSKQADLQVQKRTASFVALGNWALLRMIDTHVPTHALPSGAAGKGVLLEFNVPVSTAPATGMTQQTGTTRGYLGIVLQGTDPTTKAVLTLTPPSNAPFVAPQVKTVPISSKSTTSTSKSTSKPASTTASKPASTSASKPKPTQASGV